jgi:hypothetical protein
MKWLTLILLVMLSTPLLAQSMRLPDDGRERIQYWLPHVVAQSQPLVERTHRVYARLLQVWDQARVEPILKVVESNDGPWAASLADGHILVSYSALQTIEKINSAQFEDLVAFVLAHELAHQRADDLWHYRFFRSKSGQPVQLAKQDIGQLALQESQADHDGIKMMTVVGFNPATVVAENDFYTAWIEASWLASCTSNQQSMANACKLAKQRARDTRSQLQQIVKQKVWYDLGLYALATHQFDQGRKYLQEFARLFPHASVYNAIASSYFLQIQHHLSQRNIDQDLVYPILLDQLELNFIPIMSAKRGGQQRPQEIARWIKQARHYLNKSEQLQADNPYTLYLSAVGWLLDDNLPMAKGLLDGKLARLSSRAELDILLRILILRKQNRDQQAWNQLEQYLAKQQSTPMELKFALLEQFIQLGERLNKQDEAQTIIKQFVQHAHKQGDSIPLTWGRAKLGGRIQPAVFTKVPAWPIILEKRPATQLWLEGEPKNLREESGFFHMRDAKGRTLHRWCEGVGCKKFLAVKPTVDELYAQYDLPNRVIYLAGRQWHDYSRLGLMVVSQGNKIVQIFEQEKTGP